MPPVYRAGEPLVKQRPAKGNNPFGNPYQTECANCEGLQFRPSTPYQTEGANCEGCCSPVPGGRRPFVILIVIRDWNPADGEQRVVSDRANYNFKL